MPLPFSSQALRPSLARSGQSWHAFYALTLLLAGQLLAIANAQGAESITTESGPHFRSAKRPLRYPLHVIDIEWLSAAPTAHFKELAIDFSIQGSIPPDIELFIAPLGQAKIGQAPVYGGVQTDARAWTSKTNHHYIRLGYGAIFSRWPKHGFDGVTLSEARGDEQTRYEAGMYDHDFISVRHAVPWGAGSYTFLLRKRIDPDAGLAGAWFTALIRNNDKGTSYAIGELFFDEKELPLDKKITSFIEVYGNHSLIPRLKVSFYAPKVDGQYRPKTRAWIGYSSVESQKVSRFANAVQHGNEIKIDLIPEGIIDPNASKK